MGRPFGGRHGGMNEVGHEGYLAVTGLVENGRTLIGIKAGNKNRFTM
jgi:hypothetical protein